MTKKSTIEDSTQDLFSKLGYCKTRAPKTVVSMLPIITQYLKFQNKKNLFSHQDIQVPGSEIMYCDSLMESLLLYLTPFIQEISGVQSLFPTYNYTRIYSNGQELTNHTDRESCEISATMFIACNYQDFKWPIFMGNKAVYMDPGDIVIYQGQEVPHYRHPLISFTGESVWHMQTFFHYVRADGPLRKYAFDKRPYIGFDENVSKPQTVFGYF